MFWSVNGACHIAFCTLYVRFKLKMQPVSQMCPLWINEYVHSQFMSMCFSWFIWVYTDQPSLKPLTSKVNNIDYLVTVTPVKGWNIFGSECTVISWNWCVEARKMDKHNDLIDFDKSLIVMARQLGQRISKKGGLVGFFWNGAVSIYQSGLHKNDFWRFDRVMNSQGSLMCMRNKHCGSFLLVLLTS